MKEAMTSRKKPLRILAVVTTTLALAALPAAATESGVNTAGSDTGGSSPGRAAAGVSLSASDRQLIADMARAELAEVESGKLAVAKASDLAVKQFGERIVEDHSKANRELGELAAEKDLTLPTEPDAAHRGEIAELAKLSGPEFDRRYIDHAAQSDQPTAQRLFETAVTTAEDPKVKKFAAAQVKLIGQHIELARSVSNTTGNLAPHRAEEPYREPPAGTES